MIRVLLFASLREIAGLAEVSIPARPSGEETLSAGDLFEQLIRSAPGLEGYRKRVGVAVNEQMASWESAVAAGDEVAFYPPVSGGRQ